MRAGNEREDRVVGQGGGPVGEVVRLELLHRPAGGGDPALQADLGGRRPDRRPAASPESSGSRRKRSRAVGGRCPSSSTCVRAAPLPADGIAAAPEFPAGAGYLPDVDGSCASSSSSPPCWAACCPSRPRRARPGDLLRARPQPWATVNVCDTAGHPDGVGVRGWMPGAARAEGAAADASCACSTASRARLAHRPRCGLALGHRRDRPRSPPRRGRPSRSPRRAGRARSSCAAWCSSAGARPPALVAARRPARSPDAGHPGTAGADPAAPRRTTCTVH